MYVQVHESGSMNGMMIGLRAANGNHLNAGLGIARIADVAASPIAATAARSKPIADARATPNVATPSRARAQFTGMSDGQNTNLLANAARTACTKYTSALYAARNHPTNAPTQDNCGLSRAVPPTKNSPQVNRATNAIRLARVIALPRSPRLTRSQCRDRSGRHSTPTSKQDVAE
jgi:hypothetical protein